MFIVSWIHRLAERFSKVCCFSKAPATGCKEVWCLGPTCVYKDALIEHTCTRLHPDMTRVSLHAWMCVWTAAPLSVA
jgi:hypothetical protein